MFGGLNKSASRLALVAAAGLLSTSAYAADLGGDCCADLEERVAELEATTARKGNRKVSLQVYGWVNKAIMAWDAPARGTEQTRGVYLGQDNTNSATRFGFRGDAKVSPTLKAGYSILFDVASGARTATSTRSNEEGGVNNSTYGYDDNAIRMRDGNVWLESSSAGRLTLGRLTGAAAVGTIDLGGIGNVAPGTVLVGNNLTFANGASLGSVTDLVADYGYRQDGLRWDSPTFAGFTMTASVGETGKASGTASNPIDQGRVYGVQLRYAGEFSGVRVAAGVGYERSQDIGTFTYAATPAATLIATSTASGGNATNVGGSLSLMHAPTGLFAQGSYIVFQRDLAGVDLYENKMLIIQAGISQNWFGIGKTALYGEYHKHDIAIGATALDTKIWGLGVTQDIDAAAMQLYAGYRNHSHSSAGIDRGDIGIFLAGARINF